MKLYYLVPDWAEHAGGVRVIYRHVDLMQRNGIEAYVVHERRGFRDTWFENATPVLSWSNARHSMYSSLPWRASRRLRRGASRAAIERSPVFLRESPSFDIESDDIVILPEILGPHLAQIAPGSSKVIFVQNPYMAFRGYTVDSPSLSPYYHPEVVAVLSTSDDTSAFLNYAFPSVKSYRVRWSINSNYYHISEEKRNQIAYMPRKGAEDAIHVLNTLASRKTLTGYHVRRIENMREVEVAACLRESLIFLSLGYHEGLPLPPAEAMACGAIVVGYDGFGGREYMLPELAFPVPTGDLLTFAKTLEQVLSMHQRQPEELSNRARRASAFVTEHLSPAREEQELLGAWSEILTMLGRQLGSTIERRDVPCALNIER